MMTVFHREVLCLFKDQFLGKILFWKTDVEYPNEFAPLAVQMVKVNRTAY